MHGFSKLLYSCTLQHRKRRFLASTKQCLVVAVIFDSFKNGEYPCMAVDKKTTKKQQHLNSKLLLLVLRLLVIEKTPFKVSSTVNPPTTLLHCDH